MRNLSVLNVGQDALNHFVQVLLDTNPWQELSRDLVSRGIFAREPARGVNLLEDFTVNPLLLRDGESEREAHLGPSLY